MPFIEYYCDKSYILYQDEMTRKHLTLMFSLSILWCGGSGYYSLFELFIVVNFSAVLEKENRLLELRFCDEFYRVESHFIYIGDWRLAGVDASHPPWNRTIK